MADPTVTHPSSNYAGNGPFGGTPPVITLEVTDAVWMHEDSGVLHPTSTCAACPDPVVEEQYLVRIGGEWMHIDCGQRRIGDSSNRELVLTLASHMSYNPSKYTAGATRWILRQLLRIIATQDAAIRNGAAA